MACPKRATSLTDAEISRCIAILERMNSMLDELFDSNDFWREIRDRHGGGPADRERRTKARLAELAPRRSSSKEHSVKLELARKFGRSSTTRSRARCLRGSRGCLAWGVGPSLGTPPPTRARRAWRDRANVLVLDDKIV